MGLLVAMSGWLGSSHKDWFSFWGPRQSGIDQSNLPKRRGISVLIRTRERNLVIMMETYQGTLRLVIKDVFFVTSWGYAADHLFGWFPKAINSHPELFALLGHEGSRPKYIKERTRGQRPPISSFTYFLSDMSKTYEAIGDCYSYRADAVERLITGDPMFSGIQSLNLIRHPVVWLNFYTLWRSRHMRTSDGSSEAIEWEWRINRGPYFESLGIRGVDREDVDSWSFLQGLTHLNQIYNENKLLHIKTLPIESIAEDRDLFAREVARLARNRISYSHEQLTKAYQLLPGLYRGENTVECSPQAILDSWKPWQFDSFNKVVSIESIKEFESFGYRLGEIKTRMKARANVTNVLGSKPPAKLFISSARKSGTHALRSIINSITGYNYIEPDVVGGDSYDDYRMVNWERDCFFSWHSVITPELSSMLESGGVKTIFLVRNIYDIIFSFYNHLYSDVDADIGRSIGKNTLIRSVPFQVGLCMIINGYFDQKTGERFDGIYSELVRMRSYFEYCAVSKNVLMLSFNSLFTQNDQAIGRIIRYLEISKPLTRKYKFEKREEITRSSRLGRIMVKVLKHRKGAMETHNTNTLRRILVNSLDECHVSMVTNLFQKAFEGFDPEIYKEILERFEISDISANTYVPLKGD